ncbi:CPBP family intramembrane metalloprotease [soil metagenome]
MAFCTFAQNYERMMLRGILSDRPPYNKFLVLVGLCLIGFMTFTMLGTFLAGAIYGINLLTNPAAIQDFSNPNLILAMKMIQLFSAFGTFLLPPIIAALIFDQQPKHYLLLDKKLNIQPILIVIGLMLIMVPFINWMLVVNSGMHLPSFLHGVEEWMKSSENNAAVLTEKFMATTSINGLLINLLIIAVLPAISEELMFRGVIMRLFTELSGNRHVAVFLSAFLFSAIHMQFFGFFPRFALGLLLGYLVMWSGNLKLSMLAHFINNAGAVILGWFAARKELSFDQDTLGTTSGDELILAISVFGTWVLLFMIYKFYNRVRPEMS